MMQAHRKRGRPAAQRIPIDLPLPPSVSADAAEVAEWAESAARLLDGIPRLAGTVALRLRVSIDAPPLDHVVSQVRDLLAGLGAMDVSLLTDQNARLDRVVPTGRVQGELAQSIDPRSRPDALARRHVAEAARARLSHMPTALRAFVHG